MVVLTAHCHFKPEMREIGLEMCEKDRVGSLLEPGCEEFGYYIDPADENHVIFVELWESRQHLQAHFDGELFGEFMAVMETAVAKPPEVTIYSVDGIELME